MDDLLKRRDSLCECFSVFIHQMRRFNFRPGAFGLPARGDASFAPATRRSSSSFGTFRSRFMPVLNLRNSSDPMNCSALKGGRCVSPGLVSSHTCRSAMARISCFSGQLFVSQTATNYMPHPKDEALCIIHISVVEAEGLFVNVAEQVERLNRNVGAVKRAFQKAPEVLHSVGVDVAVNVGFQIGRAHV